MQFFTFCMKLHFFNKHIHFYSQNEVISPAIRVLKKETIFVLKLNYSNHIQK